MKKKKKKGTDLDRAGLSELAHEYLDRIRHQRTAPQEPQLFPAPEIVAPHLGQLACPDIVLDGDELVAGLG